MKKINISLQTLNLIESKNILRDFYENNTYENSYMDSLSKSEIRVIDTNTGIIWDESNFPLEYEQIYDADQFYTRHVRLFTSGSKKIYLDYSKLITYDFHTIFI